MSTKLSFVLMFLSTKSSSLDVFTWRVLRSISGSRTRVTSVRELVDPSARAALRLLEPDALATVLGELS